VCFLLQGKSQIQDARTKIAPQRIDAASAGGWSMSLPWFRFYTEVLEDPKVQTLDPEDFKHWVNLLCLAAKNDGIIPEIGNVSFALRETFTTVSTVLERLC